MASSTYKLTYFDWTGLAEITRLLFALADVQYEDERIPRDEYFPSLSPEVKARLSESAWGQVPVLEVDGLVIAQSGAINRFVARRFNFYGKDDFEAAKIDEYIESIMDYLREIIKLSLELDPTKKAEVKKNFLENVNPKYLDKFSKIIDANGGQHLVGGRITVAEVYLAHLLPYFEKFTSLDLTSNFPVVKNLIQKFDQNSKVKSWNASAPEVPPFNAEIFAELLKKHAAKK